MEYRKKLIDMIERFYIDIIEEFKEAELQIIADSNFKSMFRKKDYGGHIDMLKKCRKQALSVNVQVAGVPDDDKEAHDLVLQLERCLLSFIRLCDSYVQLMEALKRKAEKESLKYSEYKDIYNRVRDDRKTLNDELHELDILYTDYTYDETADPYEFLDKDTEK